MSFHLRHGEVQRRRIESLDKWRRLLQRIVCQVSPCSRWRPGWHIVGMWSYDWSMRSALGTHTMSHVDDSGRNISWMLIRRRRKTRRDNRSASLIERTSCSSSGPAASLSSANGTGDCDWVTNECRTLSLGHLPPGPNPNLTLNPNYIALNRNLDRGLNVRSLHLRSDAYLRVRWWCSHPSTTLIQIDTVKCKLHGVFWLTVKLNQCVFCP